MKNIFLWRKWFSAIPVALLLTGGNLFAGATVNWVSGGPNYGFPTGAGYSDGDITADAEYNTPRGIAVDVTGEDIILADQKNNVIRLLAFSGPESDVGQTFTLGYYSGVNLVTNFCNNPVGVALDSSYNVFVLNHGNGTNGSVLEIDNATGDLITNAVSLTNANGIALDTADNIYVTVNSNQLLEITSPGVSSIVATVNQPGALLQGLVVKKSGLTAGLIAVCDSARDGIYLINPITHLVTTNAGFHGQGDFLSAYDTAPSNAATFYQPMDVAEAGDGTLVVSDYGNSRVKVVLANGSVTNLYGVSSNDWVYYNQAPYQFPGFVDGTVTVPDQLGGVAARLPFGVAFAPDGSVYVTEDYYHIIRHVTGAGFVPPPPPPPPPPTGLTATPGYGQITLSWTGSPGATNYNVKRSTSSGHEGTIASISGTSTSYTDTNSLSDGTVYYYVVSASDASGESTNSAEVSASPLFSLPPVNLTVTATNYGSISLAWSLSAGATSYNLKRSTTSGAEVTITNVTATSYTDTNVVNGTPYFYVVSAVNAGGANPTNSVEVSATPPLPPVTDPQIGYVDFPATSTPIAYTSVFHSVPPAGATFNNDVNIVIVGAAENTLFYNYANTATVTNVPDPTSSSASVQAGYANGLPNASDLTPYEPSPQVLPNLAIKAIGEQNGHPNSAVVSALFQFVVGNPQVVGTNAAQFVVTNITVGSQMYYTYSTNGVFPTPPNPTNLVAAFGPYTNGATLSLQFPNGVTNLNLEFIGIKANYQPSAVTTNSFSITNFVENIISFGLASGPGSCQFIASPGQTFTVPVGLTLVSDAPPLYGLQFNVTLTNLTSHLVVPSTIDFGSLVGKPDPTNTGYFDIIPPYMFVSDSQPNNDPDIIQYDSDWYQNLVFSDTNNEDLLGVGWLEVYGRTNLYDTLSQNLITYPVLRGNDPYPTTSPIVGYYTFAIPTNAVPGDVYQIQLGRPSGTTFQNGLNANPYGLPVVIAAPADTNKLGPGSVNALKNITIGSFRYLVGDVHPANWFNAGDFGSSNLDNLDVTRVFDFAVYPVAAPPYGSDLFDALDSCGNIGVMDSNLADPNYGYLTNANTYFYFTNISYTITNNTFFEDTNGVAENTNSAPAGPFTSLAGPVYLTTFSVTVNEEYTNTYIITNADLTTTTNVVPINNFVNVPITPGNSTLFNGNDSTINQIAFGDGVLDVCDVYVTFRRSLDTNNLVWFQRFWTNGVRVAIATNAGAVISGAVQSEGVVGSPIHSDGISGLVSTNPPLVNFTAGDYQTSAGHTVQIPITANVLGNYPLRVLMLNLNVDPLDGAPPLTTAVSFNQTASVLGSPYLTSSDGNGNYASVWLNSTNSGLTGSSIIGTLSVTIPANATSGSAYAVHFDHASASPNGLASFPKQTLTGIIMLSSTNYSSYNDGIPDIWRLRWFGTIDNLLSVSNACPSGDGINNWMKYVAGVDPNQAGDFPSLHPKPSVPTGDTAAIHWPTVFGKQYVILRSSNIFSGPWTSISTNTGTGEDMEFDDNATSSPKFYRVQILP